MNSNQVTAPTKDSQVESFDTSSKSSDSQETQLFRVVDINGNLSSNVYSILDKAGTNHYLMSSVNNAGSAITVNRDRLVAVQDEKGFVANQGSRTKGSKEVNAETQSSDNATEEVAQQTEESNTNPKPKPKPKGATKAKDANKPAGRGPAPPCNLEEIASFGTQLWERSGIPFDHTMEVCSYVLINDDAKTRINFMTYGGSLGRKPGKLEALCLEQFSQGLIEHDGKVIAREVEDVESLTKSLTKKGYKKIHAGTIKAD